MIVVDETQCGKGIALPAGEMLALRLREQGTSGYTWSVEEADGLALRASSFTPGGDAVGAAGVREFRFLAAEAGTYVLRLKHWRDWQGEGSVIGRCRLDVRVE